MSTPIPLPTWRSLLSKRQLEVLGACQPSEYEPVRTPHKRRIMDLAFFLEQTLDSQEERMGYLQRTVDLSLHDLGLYLALLLTISTCQNMDDVLDALRKGAQALSIEWPESVPVAHLTDLLQRSGVEPLP